MKHPYHRLIRILCIKISLYLFASIILTFSIPVEAQTCGPVWIIFSNQDSIDDFAVNYPGCTQVLGDVIIEESAAGTITNLNGLSQLLAIDGDLKILDNTSLSSLNGLSNVTSVGGDMNIYQNDVLTNFTGLNGLTTIGGFLWVRENSDLVNLAGLENLNAIGGSATIQNNSSLTGLKGLDNLSTIGGDLLIENNSSLDSLSGLSSLTIIEGDLDIYNNSSLKSLEVLYNLDSINGQLGIFNNDDLTTLAGLDNIDHTTISNLLLRYCDTLSICHVSSICEFLENGGSALVANNYMGCSSTNEIQDSCSMAPPHAEVTNTNDSGPGSLRNGIETIDPGDTLFFGGGMVDDTISLDSAVRIDKDIIIYASSGQDIWINGSSIENTLNILPGNSVEIIGIYIFGSNGVNGVVWNRGHLILEAVTVQGDGSPGAIFVGDGTLILKGNTTIL